MTEEKIKELKKLLEEKKLPPQLKKFTEKFIAYHEQKKGTKQSNWKIILNTKTVR